MSDKVFVDTNILLYAHDRSTGVKHDRARSRIEKLWDSGGGILSTQVLQELRVNLRRKTARPLSNEKTRALLQDHLSWNIVINTAESILEALVIEQRYNISFWDALIIKLLEAPERRLSTQKICRTGRHTSAPRYQSVEPFRLRLEQYAKSRSMLTPFPLRSQSDRRTIRPL